MQKIAMPVLPSENAIVRRKRSWISAFRLFLLLILILLLL